MQTRKRSAIESFVMIILGMGYAIPLNYVMIHKMTWATPWTQAFWITFWFTVLSFVFKYSVRRFFNWFDHKHPPATISSDAIVSKDGKMIIDVKNKKIILGR